MLHTNLYDILVLIEKANLSSEETLVCLVE
jgi:hypothetical protein